MARLAPVTAAALVAAAVLALAVSGAVAAPPAPGGRKTALPKFEFCKKYDLKYGEQCFIWGGG